MRYWSNKRASGNSLFTLGNGKMLIYECGPNIRNIYAPYYTGPCFGALNFNDLDFVAECKSQYDLDSNLYKHEMYKTVFEGKPYAWFEDSIDSGKCIFKRAGECLDSMSFKFVLPSYVKVQKLKDCNIYKNKKTDFLVLVIPKGTGFLNEFILKEDLNLIVGLGGCAEFTEDFEEIRIGRGKFEIYIVSADEIHLIKEVSGALRKNTVNCISDEDSVVESK